MFEDININLKMDILFDVLQVDINKELQSPEQGFERECEQFCKYNHGAQEML